MWRHVRYAARISLKRMTLRMRGRERREGKGGRGGRGGREGGREGEEGRRQFAHLLKA